MSARGTAGLGRRETTSATDGSFTLTGLDQASYTIVADQPLQGESTMKTIAAGDTDASVDLTIEQPVRLTGRITQHGTPVSQAVVTLSPTGATSSRFVVATDTDGRYVFDRVPAGSATVAAGPRGGSALLRSQQVDLAAGTRSQIDFDLPDAGATVHVRLTSRSGNTRALAQTYLIGASVSATTGDELEQVLTQNHGASIQLSQGLVDSPVQFTHVEPGSYTICVLRAMIPPGAPDAIARAKAEAGNWPVVCQPLQVQDGSEQFVNVELL
jgi:hypothetical protein